MDYGSDGPVITATTNLTEPPPTLNYAIVFYATLGGQNQSGSVSGTYPNYTLTIHGIASGIPAPAPGAYSLTATFSLGTVGPFTSAPITLTVNRATVSSFGCDIAPSGTGWVYAADSSLAITPNGTGPPGQQIDFQNATYTLGLAGPTKVTDSGLTTDSAGSFHTRAPAQPGDYTGSCTFGGTSFYKPATGPTNFRSITVSAGHSVGGIELFTDPAPIHAGAPTTWTVIVKPGAGLPYPTGSAEITAGNSYSGAQSLAADGTLVFQATSPATQPGTTLMVNYFGDNVYLGTAANFAITTLPPAPPAAAPSPSLSVGVGPSAPPSSRSSRGTSPSLVHTAARSSSPPAALLGAGAALPAAALACASWFGWRRRKGLPPWRRGDR
jgi:hypothetical protein